MCGAGQLFPRRLIAAGALEEEVTAQPWEQLVKRRIFEPLHMNSSFPNLTAAMSSTAKSALAAPYVDGRVRLAAGLTRRRPSPQQLSTAPACALCRP